MAKRSKIAKNEQRRRTVARYAERRRELKAVVKDTSADAGRRRQAMHELERMPRDASPTRIVNRDMVDGRPRGYMRKFGLSRISFREKAHEGEIPGVTKASW